MEVSLPQGLALRLFLFAVVMDMLGRRAIQLGQRKAEYERVHERSSGPKTRYMGVVKRTGSSLVWEKRTHRTG